MPSHNFPWDLNDGSPGGSLMVQFWIGVFMCVWDASLKALGHLLMCTFWMKTTGCGLMKCITAHHTLIKLYRGLSLNPVQFLGSLWKMDVHRIFSTQNCQQQTNCFNLSSFFFNILLLNRFWNFLYTLRPYGSHFPHKQPQQTHCPSRPAEDGKI